MAEHDIILTSFVANLSQTREHFLDTMCKRNVREGTESFATIGAVFLEILRKDWRGEYPPTRAQVKTFDLVT